MAFYYVFDGVVDTAVAFDTDEGGMFSAFLSASFVAVSGHDFSPQTNPEPEIFGQWYWEAYEAPAFPPDANAPFWLNDDIIEIPPAFIPAQGSQGGGTGQGFVLGPHHAKAYGGQSVPGVEYDKTAQNGTLEGGYTHTGQEAATGLENAEGYVIPLQSADPEERGSPEQEAEEQMNITRQNNDLLLMLLAS